MITRFAVLLAVAFLIAACTTPIKTEVTRFHALPPSHGESFIIVSKTAAMEGSLELTTYANIVSNYLMAEGFMPAGANQPDLIVKVGFGISPPIERHRHSPSYYPFYSSFYYYSDHPFYFGYYWPYYYRSHFDYGFRYSTYDYSYVVYERTFEMIIERSNGQILFEGHASSIGRNKILPEVIPYLVQAMFAEFPGQSGATTVVAIKPEKNAGY